MDFETTPNVFLNNEIEIILQPRGRKFTTIVSGLPKHLNLSKIMSHLKEKLGCSGNVVKDKNGITFLSLTGDQRMKIKMFLIEEKICEEDEINFKG